MDTGLQSLARAVRARRKALSLTQKQLADLAGTGPVFIYDVESAKPTLRVDKLLDVLQVLGLSLRLSEGAPVLQVGEELSPQDRDD